jgi:hypothetical protein
LNSISSGLGNSVDVVLEQQGVLRVNCKDCLDRTNSVMSKVAYYHLLQMLAVEFGLKLGVNNSETSGNNGDGVVNSNTSNEHLS